MAATTHSDRGLLTAEIGAAHPKAWLVSQPGSAVRICHLLTADTTRIGRAPDNDLIVQGPESITVSLHHLAVERVMADGLPEFRVRDLESTNGTFVNGSRTAEAALHPQDSIRLGMQGPELSFVLEEPAALELDQTSAIPAEVVVPVAAAAAAASSKPLDAGTYENLLSEGIRRARHARAHGLGGQTMTIMRETLNRALHHHSRRSRLVTGALTVGLLVVSGAAGWKIVQLNREKHAIDGHIAQLEAQLEKASSSDEADRLITQLDSYEAEGLHLQDNLLYRFGSHSKPDFVTTEIRGLLAEFGAEVYSVPPEFSDRVKYYIQQYQGPNRSIMVRALGVAEPEVAQMRQLLEQQHLPPDLAYIPLVESTLQQERSRAGAVGPWQFTTTTAKEYGLRVGDGVDERVSVVKSTHAACLYLRDLILDFGTGSSVMLALAAYNVGPSKVKQAIKHVNDPIKQRNFWYLYRVRALPLETREYVPKVIAAMIIGRNPSRFGF